MNKIITSVLLDVLVPRCLAVDEKVEKTKPAQSVPELRLELENILTNTHTPGVSVAVVDKAGAEWPEGLGVVGLGSKPVSAFDKGEQRRLMFPG